MRPIRRFRQCKTIGLVESKLLAQDGTLLATATAAVRVGAPLESGTAPRRSVEGRTGLRLRRLQLAAIALLLIVSGIPARAQNRQCFQCMAVEGCAHFRQNPRYPPAATGPFAADSPQCQRASGKCGGACCPTHDVLRPFIETFNEAVDRVPGLSDAL